MSALNDSEKAKLETVLKAIEEEARKPAPTLFERLTDAIARGILMSGIAALVIILMSKPIFGNVILTAQSVSAIVAIGIGFAILNFVLESVFARKSKKNN